MSTANKLYLTGIVSGALVVLLLLPWGHLYALPGQDLFGLTVLIVIGILSEALSVSYDIGNSRAASSVAFVPILATAVLFPPAAAVACALSVSVVTETAILRKAPWKVAFNSAQGVLAAALSAYVISATSTGAAPLELGGFFLGATALFLTNHICVGGFIAISQQSSLGQAVRKVMGGTGTSIIFDVLVAPVSLVVAIFYTDYGPLGLMVISLPLLLVRHAYLSKMQVQRANKDLLRVLIKAIETRDPYTSGHSVRVSVLARAIAEDMALPGPRVDAVETAALLHDIGKIDGIYADLISKPHGLSSEERSIIRTHATKGADFLQSLSSFNEEIIKGVRHHHERFDGRGYPQGLAGSDIPLVSRIIMLCDSVDAMLSDRPYRRALPLPAVETELQRCTGDQFDPEIVAVVLEKRTLLRAAQLVDLQREHQPDISPSSSTALGHSPAHAGYLAAEA